jgi:hypothetical protein
MGSIRTALSIALLTVGSLVCAPQARAGEGSPNASRVTVESSRASAFVTISINHHRKIGTVTLEVKDSQGRTLYREEGKAMQDELVRRLDKGILPRGEHTVVITARDLALTERFTVE